MQVSGATASLSTDYCFFFVYMYNTTDLGEGQWEALSSYLSDLPSGAHTIVMGDMNAHINRFFPVLNPCALHASPGGTYFRNLDCVDCKASTPWMRNSADDTPLDRSGRLALSLCCCNQLVPLNGLSIHGRQFDPDASFWRSGRLSVIDHVYLPVAAIRDVSQFVVHSWIPGVSDHSALELSLKQTRCTWSCTQLAERPMCRRRLRGPLSVDRTIEELENPCHPLHTVTQAVAAAPSLPLAETAWLQQAALQWNATVSQLADRADAPAAPSLGSKLASWFDADCVNARQAMRMAQRRCIAAVIRNGSHFLARDSNAVLSMRSTKKAYSKLCKRKRMAWSLQRSGELASSLVRSPRDFWRLFRQVTGHRCLGSAAVDVEPLTRHYTSLFNRDEAALALHPLSMLSEASAAVERYVCDSNGLASDMQRDSFTISRDDVAFAVCRLRSSAPGLDGWTAPFLRSMCEVPIFLDSLTLLFQQLLHSGLHPDMWRLAQICPVPKRGGSMLAEHTRPIHLLSVLYKAYTRILRSRFLGTYSPSSVQWV